LDGGSPIRNYDGAARLEIIEEKIEDASRLEDRMLAGAKARHDGSKGCAARVLAYQTTKAGQLARNLPTIRLRAIRKHFIG
jgi:hypothetical protein